MNTLQESLQDYLALRRSLGYKMHDESLMLPKFVEFINMHQALHITTRLALEWAQKPSVQPAEWARRLCFVRGFARYRSATDVLTEVPPLGLLPYRSKRATPHMYTDVEIQSLLAAALQLPTAWTSSLLRPWVFHCLLGLLSVTGLRISEALDLKVEDIDLEQSILTIRGPKFDRTRLVPIHASTCAILSQYLERRRQFFDKPISSFVFVNRCGNRLDIGHVHRTFYALSRSVGLRRQGDSKGPRLHDFRHRFAVQVLMRWYQSGEDPARLLPVLSTYLGHVCVSETYWYLSSWPELMSQAVTRLETYWEQQP